MKIGKLVVQLIVVIVLSIGSVSFCEKPVEIPKGFENIYLGMTFQELGQVRLEIQPDDWIPVYEYSERVDNNFYDMATYIFEKASEEQRDVENTDSLTTVDFAKSWENVDTDTTQVVQDYVNGLIEQFGNDFTVTTKIMRYANPNPVFKIYLWEKTDVIIKITVSSEEDESYKKYLSLDYSKP